MRGDDDDDDDDDNGMTINSPCLQSMHTSRPCLLILCRSWLLLPSAHVGTTEDTASEPPAML